MHVYSMVLYNFHEFCCCHRIEKV
uniref:Uncharacterized protein n=1 Tax=Arundo donax TaxID=35708 RepID=A0A0A8Y8L6_ARUDO